jgi:hypothetical protein
MRRTQPEMMLEECALALFQSRYPDESFGSHQLKIETEQAKHDTRRVLESLGVPLDKLSQWVDNRRKLK